MKKILVCHNGDPRIDAMIHTFELIMLVHVITTQTELETSIMNGDYKYLILPITGVDEELMIRGSELRLHENLLMHLKGVTILTGLVHPELTRRCQNYGITCISYLTEDFAIKNNYITSEGIIEKLVSLSPKAIYNSRILIVGYGKLGQVLGKVLNALQSQLTIAARDPKDRTRIKIDGHIAVNYDELNAVNIPFDFVITTVPYPVIHEQLLQRFAESNTLVLDVSSYPYSFDLELAERLNVNAYRLPQIPGKIAPETSGILLAEAILSLMEGGESNDE